MMGVPMTGNVTWNAHEIHKLIEFVRQKECLYASECPDYNNRDVVWAHWSEISKILNKPAVACRDKWTNLRGVYRRLVMQSPYQRLPVRNKARKTWSWEAYMSFLKPHLHHRKSGSRGHAEDKPFGEVEAQYRADPYDDYSSHQHHPSHHQHSSDASNAGSSGPPVPPSNGSYDESPMGLSHAKTETMDDFLRLLQTTPSSAAAAAAAVAAAAHARPTRSPLAPGAHHQPPQTPLGYKIGEEGAADSASSCSPPPPHLQPLAAASTISDPDEMFFKSLIPDVKLLPARDRGAFKLRVLQMLQDMLYPKPLSALAERQHQQT